MTSIQFNFVLLAVLLALVAKIAFCNDIKKSEIKVVFDETRYTTLNPNATCSPFQKVNNVKGNIIFTAGQRINGDRLGTTIMDECQYARSTDIEVSFLYPAEGFTGLIISCVEFVTHLSSSDADVFFVNSGGIGSDFAEILITANHTEHFGYQMFLYGY